MKKHYLLLVFAAVVALTFNCASTNLDEIAPPPSGGPCDSTYVFNGKVSKIIKQNCSGVQHSSGCHASGAGQGDFSSYSGVKAKIDGGSFSARVLQNKDMPPGYSPGPNSLSDCDLKVLQNWINSGAPQ